MDSGIVIIGAGLAGTTVARELAERGIAVTLVDPQVGRTCERPPLSKHLFDAGRYHLPYHLEASELIRFVPARAESITLAEAGPGVGAVAGPTAGTVHLDDGTDFDFTRCVLATGMKAVAPQVANYPEARPVYDLADAEAIREFVGTSTEPLHIGVLGSGYLGTEVAASAVAAGHWATMYLRGDEILRRQLSAPVRQALTQIHAQAGVRILPREGAADRIPAGVHDLFVTSVGARPVRIPIIGPESTADPKKTSGATITEVGRATGGVRPDAGAVADGPDSAWPVNEKLATSHPGIWAIGDCARITAGPYVFERPWACEPVAESHGKYLAEQFSGATNDAWSDVPWHWSFQGPQKVFTAGLTSADADDTVIREGQRPDRFQVFHFAGADPDAPLVGVETLNWPPLHAAARRVLAGANIPTRAQVSDLDFDLKAHSRL